MDTPDSPTVADVIRDYLLMGTEGNTAETLYNKRLRLTEFAETFGDHPAASIKTVDVLRWIHSHDAWGAWMKSGAVRMLKAAFNWAWKMDLIPKNPIHWLTVPRGERRRHMAEEEYRGILRNSHSAFRLLFTMLAHTGMRLGEVANMRWSDVAWERSCIVLAKHKTAKKVDRPRIIPLSTVVRKLLEYQLRYSPIGIAAMMQTLLANGQVSASVVIRAIRPMNIRDVNVKHGLAAAGVIKLTPRYRKGKPVGTGWYYTLGGTQEPIPKHYQYVFRNTQNARWRTPAVAAHIRYLRRDGVIPDDCFIHSARHRWATNALLNGVELPLVSTLLGHSSVAMTEHYTHLTADVEPLVKAMERAGKDRTVKKMGIRYAVPDPAPRTVRRLSAIVTTHGGAR